MITLQSLTYGLIFIGSVVVVLVIHARAHAKGLANLERAVEFIAEALDDLPAGVTEKTLSARITAVEALADKQEDAYKRLRGTVARLHRADVRPPEDDSTVPAPSDPLTMDPAQKAAYKESLREAARKAGHRL